MEMIRVTQWKTSVLFLGASLCIVGCGGDTEPEDSSSAPATETQPSTASEAPSAPPLTSPAGGEHPLGVEEHESGGVEVTLTQVQRASGDTLNVRWRYHNGTPDEQTLFEGYSSWYTQYRLAADTYILDLVNQKKHLVLKADGNPITSQTTHDYGTLTLDPDGTINAWAKFPAPPSTVETISVYISGVPPFEDIPISD